MEVRYVGLGFSGDVLNMDVELSRKLAEAERDGKKVDGGGDIIGVHRRLEEDVDVLRSRS